MRRFVELSHLLAGDESMSPSSTPPRIGRVLGRLISGEPAGRGSAVHLLLKGTGTCLHGPRATSREADMSTLPLDLVAGVPGAVIPARSAAGRVISGEALAGLEELAGRAVLLQTRWDVRWGTGSYLEPGPYLSQEAAEILIEAGTKILGVDFWNVDEATGAERPVRERILGAGIPLVESLANLSALPRSGFRFYAVPLRIARAASLPVRAFAEVG